LEEGWKKVEVVRPESEYIVHISEPQGGTWVDGREKVCFKVAHPKIGEDWG
jgi:hypothetical protein